MDMTHQTFRLTALSSALLLVFGTAFAEDDAVAELIEPDSSVSIGIGNWSGDRPQMGIFDAMRDSGTYGLIDADVVKRDNATGTWMKIKASGLGLDNRELRGDYTRQGHFGGYLEYNKTTRDNPYTINTPLQGIGSETLTVGTIAAGTFPSREVTLGTTREMSRLGGFKTIAPGLELKIDFKNEDKKGTRQSGWGSAGLFSVEPIDSTTRQLETVLQYTGAKFQLSGGYYGSWYDNNKPLVLQQLNGLPAGGSASFNAVTPLSLPLDNQAHQFFIDGGYSFTPTTRGTFKVAYTKATQDEHIPSYDLTGANAPFVNAPSHLDGRVDTTLIQLGLSSRPMPKLRVTANLRYNDVNDKTPIQGFVGSNSTGIATVYNTPQSFTTTTGKVEATYRLPQNFSLIGGVEHKDQDRSYPRIGDVYVPFRSNVKEMTYKLQLRHTLGDGLNGSLSYLRSNRDGSSYTDASGGPEYANEINPMHIADRTRDKWSAAVNWDPSEQLSMQFRVDLSKDNYPHNGRPYGLHDGSAQLYSIDTTYVLSDDWKISAWYSYDMTKARSLNPKANRITLALEAEKDTHSKDTGHSFGLNVRGNVSSKIGVGLGLDWFKNTSSYTQELTGPLTTLGTSVPVPDVKSRLLRLKLDSTYTIDKKSEVRLDLVHERWRTNDWTWTFADGTPFTYYSGSVSGGLNAQDGTTVSSQQRQSNSFVGVRYIYRFQ